MDLIKPIRNSKMDIGQVYFWTSSIFGWRNLLESDHYKDILIQSLQFLASNNKINVYGFVLMPNHIHLLWEMLELNGKEVPYVSFQKFTAHTFQCELKKSDTDWLESFSVKASDRAYRFWQCDPLAVPMASKSMFVQKLNYIHNNPLQEHWNLVDSPEQYYYSSAAFYEEEDLSFPFLTHYMDRF